MKLAVAGIGYVGLVHAACLADKGHFVTCVDVDEERVRRLQAGQSPLYEPGLDELLERNREQLRFTTDYAQAYRDAQIIFIAVGTPEKVDGSVNMKFILDVVEQVGTHVSPGSVVVMKSTVPPGTGDTVEALLRRHAGWAVPVVSNPEFLSQGTAVRDTLHASRIVVGASDEQALDTMRELYSGFDAPLVCTDRSSAEMIKYASNDFLALKISYINEIANVCELVGADIEAVARGMGYDERIGNRFLKAGIGYGGSCFPKDTKALHWLAGQRDYELKTIKAAIEVNENQKVRLLNRARRIVGHSFHGLTVAVLGLTFKPHTDDLREAPSLACVPVLLEDGARVQAWDPLGMEAFRRSYPAVQPCDSIEQALSGADLCFIFTEWPQVVAMDVGLFARLMKTPLVLDGRNCFAREAFAGTSIRYESIGRKPVNG